MACPAVAMTASAQHRPSARFAGPSHQFKENSMKFGIGMVAGVIVIFLIAYGFDVITAPEPLAPMRHNQSGGIPVTDHQNQSQVQPAK